MSDDIKKDISLAIKTRDDNINELRKKMDEASDWFKDKIDTNYEEYSNSISRLDMFLKKFQENKFLSDLIDIVKLKNLNMINEVISNVNSDATELFKRTTYSYAEDQIEYIMNSFTKLSTYIEDEYNRIRYLKVLGVNNVVLMGANGSGKSSFASFMKESMSDKIIVLPAQKILYLETGRNSDYTGTTIDDFLEVRDRNFNKKNTFTESYSFNTNINELKGVFTMTVTLTVNEYVEYTVAEKRGEILEKDYKETNFEIFERLWSKLIPSITWNVDTVNKVVTPIKNCDKYNVNDLSDGEKAIIFYILSVLNAKVDSYIIVDEPETYLNPATYKNMWNMLEEARPDCTFIYISHNIDFIESRYFHELYWIRDYDGNKEWDFKKVDDKAYNLPKNMLAELLGANLPIIFCEGAESSNDYLVYSTLFDNHAIIIPVGSCHNVEKYTRSYRKLPNKTDAAYGLIDRDLKSDEESQGKLIENIFTLYFNEIEMLLICEPILRAVLNSKSLEENEIEIKVCNFKNKVFETVIDRKQEILNKIRSSIFNYKLEGRKAEEKDSVEEILNDFREHIESLDIDGYIEKLSKTIDAHCKNENYEELLKIIPFKDLLNVASNDIYSPYQKKAIDCLRENPKVREELLNKYFEPLKDKIFIE